MTHIQCIITKIVLVTSIKYTPVTHTNHIMHNLFNVCSNHAIFKLQKTRIKKTQFAIYISDKPVTLKQSQGYKMYNDTVNPK